MIGFLLMSHGDLAKGALNSLECIAGEQENMIALTLAIDDDINQFEEEMNQALSTLNTGDGVLIMVDVLGGTPSNKSAFTLRNQNIEVVTGLNLPMLLTAIETRTNDMNLSDMKKHIIENTISNIVDLREHIGL